MTSLCNAINFQLWLCTLVWIGEALAVVTFSQTASSISPNPTTCYTALITPQPTGVFCDKKRQVLPSSSDIPFTTFAAGPGNLTAIARDACLENQECLSYKFSYVVRHEYVDIKLYNQTLEQLGLHNPPNGSIDYYAGHFFDRNCYTVKCHTTTGVAPPIKTCAPSYTQFVRDPSFEGKSHYWNYQEHATLVTDDPQNASSGKNYVRFDLPNRNSLAIISQEIPGLQYGTFYFVRMLVRLVTIRGAYCYFGGTVGSLGAVGHDDLHVKYIAQSSIFQSNSHVAVFNLTVTVGCNGPSTIYLDDLTISSLTTGCMFKLKMQSSDNRWNGQFFSYQGYSYMGRSFREAEATVFSLDQFGYIYSVFQYSYIDFLGATFLYDPDIGPLQYWPAQLPSTFLRCSIDASNIMSCGSYRFLYCVGFNGATLSDFVDGPFYANSSVTLSFCSPITLEAIYV